MQIEESVQSGFQEGMKLEVPVKDSSEAYWAASIVMACGPLLRYVQVKFMYQTNKNITNYRLTNVLTIQGQII